MYKNSGFVIFEDLDFLLLLKALLVRILNRVFMGNKQKNSANP
jgi:hypothetical protein